MKYLERLGLLYSSTEYNDRLSIVETENTHRHKRAIDFCHVFRLAMI